MLFVCNYLVGVSFQFILKPLFQVMIFPKMRVAYDKKHRAAGNPEREALAWGRGSDLLAFMSKDYSYIFCVTKKSWTSASCFGCRLENL